MSDSPEKSKTTASEKQARRKPSAIPIFVSAVRSSEDLSEACPTQESSAKPEPMQIGTSAGTSPSSDSFESNIQTDFSEKSPRGLLSLFPFSGAAASSSKVSSAEPKLMQIGTSTRSPLASPSFGSNIPTDSPEKSPRRLPSLLPISGAASSSSKVSNAEPELMQIGTSTRSPLASPSFESNIPTDSPEKSPRRLPSLLPISGAASSSSKVSNAEPELMQIGTPTETPSSPAFFGSNFQINSSEKSPRRLLSLHPISAAASSSKSSAKPELMQLSTPTGLAPLAFPELHHKEPRDPSPRPKSLLERRLGFKFHSILAPCMCNKAQLPTPTEPRYREFPLIRIGSRNRPNVLVPSGALDRHQLREVTKFAPSNTHMDSLVISRTQCFLVSAGKAVTHAEHREKLGTCVVFLSRECKDPSNCSGECPHCHVCLDMYTCNCRPKFLGTRWCPHIHVMHELTAGMYLHDGLMFFHENWKYTEMRHLRAFVQGPTKMKYNEQENLWEEQFEYMMRSQIYRVKVLEPGEECACPADKVCELCDSCLCRYACTCVDYVLDEQVCQHIHNVAMQRHKNCKELFEKFVEFGSDYYESRKESADRNRRYYIEQEHQMSYYFKEPFEKRPASGAHGARWRITVPETKPGEVVVKENPQKERDCYCGTDRWTKANSCTRCGICDRHFVCNCAPSKHVICRHIHAVARQEARIEESPHEMLKYLNEKCPHEDPEIVRSAPADVLPIRSLEGLIEGRPQFDREECYKTFSSPYHRFC